MAGAQAVRRKGLERRSQYKDKLFKLQIMRRNCQVLEGSNGADRAEGTPLEC